MIAKFYYLDKNIKPRPLQIIEIYEEEKGPCSKPLINGNGVIHNKPAEEPFFSEEANQARQIAMYFSKILTKSSLATIGSQIGGKDHATVLHACKTVNNLSETDKRFRVFIEDIEKKLKM